MTIYERLGVRRRINAAGTLTRLGGSLMPPEVLDAMREAAACSVDMAELQAAASDVIARHTGAEAGIVTTGAAAGLTLAACACIARMDPARMDRLPDTEGMARDIVIPRAHRTAYDHGLRAAGARLVEVGLNDRATGAGVRGLEAWEIEAAIGNDTVALAWTAHEDADPPLPVMVEVARRRGLPVIVDAAAELPPRANLRRFIEEGASLVTFSGGKALQGPQASGILCGERELIASALLQQIDMDTLAATWQPPAALVPPGTLVGLPHHGLGRGFKAGKEEIAGLLVALQRFAARDLEAEAKAQETRLAAIAERLGGVRGLETSLRPAAGERPPLLELRLDEGVLGLDALALSARLGAGMPPVHLVERQAHRGILAVDARVLDPADDPVVVERLLAAVQGG